MSFCCGASMIGTKGTLKHAHTQIHNIPLLFCPVCHRVEVHYLIRGEYEILAEYAESDQAPEVDFEQYVDHEGDRSLYENCVNNEDEDPLDVVVYQIDMALDLLMVAKDLGDEEWQQQLFQRLKVLNQRRNKLLRKKSVK